MTRGPGSEILKLMKQRMPSIFLSHGAPSLVIDQGAAHRFLVGLAGEIPAPREILVVSAHWETASRAVSSAGQPDTIHDFGGFAPELYRITYPAPGAPGLARRTAELLEAAGLDVSTTPDRGLDHSAWVPLKLAFPEAKIPVTQLSIQPAEGPRHHYRVGEALGPLRDEGVLVMVSGAVTHNLRAFFKGGFGHDADPPDWVSSFSVWLAAAAREGRWEDILAYRERAPFGRKNHPTEDHILPLFVALGAASNGHRARRLHASYSYGVLAMDIYAMG